MKVKLLVVLLLFNTCKNISKTVDCKENLYEQVVYDFRDNSYFVKILVATDENNMAHYCISNYDLYNILITSEKWSKKYYATHILSKLKNNAPIILNDTLPTIFTVNTFQSIDSIANEGKVDFINHFFKNGSQKIWLSDTQKVYVASKLFDWCILSKISDESGDLVIREL